MTLEIIRIDGEVATCELDDGQLIDIGTRWLPQDVKVGQSLEFEIKA